MSCKAFNGSWNLHKTPPKDLDFFILLSSVSGVAGYLSQADYLAGNTYQDSLARHRIMNEQKAVLLDLGVIDNVGYVTERPGMRESVKMHGILPISDTELLALLDYHCDPNLGILSPSTCQVVTGLEVPASMLAQGLEPAYWMSKTQFRGLHQMNSDNSAKTPITNSEDKVDTAALLAASESIDKAASIVSDSLAKKLSSRLSMPLENIDPTRPMHSFGVDSLVAKELRNWFAKEIGADVSVFEILGNESIADLRLEAVGRSRHCHHSVERTREGS